MAEITVCGGDSSRSAGGVGRHQDALLREILGQVLQTICGGQEVSVNGATPTGY